MYKALVILLLAGCASAQAAGYRCEQTIDGNRIVEYRELPKEGYNCIAIGKAPPPSQDPDAAMQKLRDKLSKPNEPVKSEEEIKAAEARAARRAENCDIAKKNVELLQGEQDILRTDAQGKKSLLNEEQRSEELQKMREQVELYCAS